MVQDGRVGILMGTTWTARGLIFQASDRQFKRVKGKSEASLDAIELVKTIETRFCVTRLLTKTVPKRILKAHLEAPKNHP
jgi:hypothetical protein